MERYAVSLEVAKALKWPYPTEFRWVEVEWKQRKSPFTNEFYLGTRWELVPKVDVEDELIAFINSLNAPFSDEILEKLPNGYGVQKSMDEWKISIDHFMSKVDSTPIILLHSNKVANVLATFYIWLRDNHPNLLEVNIEDDIS